MHDIEPYYNWRHIYVSEEDSQSPFYGREYSEFEFSQTIYNYYIHPQWDDFGSKTLYLKVLMADYEEGYAILELIGEWNDAIENDIMTFKTEVVNPLTNAGIRHFILITENVLNFHGDIKDYYEEWAEELRENEGWAIILNMPDATQHDYRKLKLDRYISIVTLNDWRVYKPFHLFKKVQEELGRLLGD